MARIAGINIPLNKRSEIGLTYIYGIGQSTAHNLLDAVLFSGRAGRGRLRVRGRRPSAGRCR